MNSSSNLFTVLTLIAAPAVLTNASSVLALNTANRFGRVIDRSRVLAKELQEGAYNEAQRAARVLELQRLRTRGQLLIRAQSVIYAALGSFVATGLVAIVGAVLAENGVSAARLVGLIGFLFGLVAAGCLLYGCALIVRETRLALAGLSMNTSTFGDQLPQEPQVVDSQQGS